jgi:cephalosporin-C deacetylase
MRNSDTPYTAMYPGQLTDGLASLETYVYTGIAADIMRGLDYLSSRDEVRKDCVIACGNDNAILAAALHDAVTHVISQPAYLFDTLESAAKTSSYPLEEFNDYLREYPDRKERVAETLEYFNLRWHAQAVTVPTLLMAEYENGLYSAGKLTNLVEDIAGEVSIHESERSSYKDGIFLERWITERSLGPSAIPILPTHWTNKSS